jgi:putative peptidoglycan lipid II flippase
MRKESSLGHTARSTLVVSGLTMVSRILGFVRTAVISALFGASGMADVINLTFNIPNNFRKLLAEGALSAAFIPVLSEALVEDQGVGKKPRSIVQNIISFQLLLLIPLTLISLIFARPLVEGILAGFREPWQGELAVKLFRWFINYLLLISVSAAIMGALNSCGSFFVPAVTPVLFSIFVISSLLMFHATLGPYSMVLGVLLGGAAQILFQTPSFIRSGFSFHPNFHFNNPHFRRIMKQWLPVMVTSSVFTITQVVAFRLASALETGSTSALSYAVVFWQLPMGIFSAAIITVLFPKMSRQFARGDRDALRDSYQYGLRFMAVFLIPSAVYLILFGPETIALALQRGEFTAENTIMTARVMGFYSLGLFSVAIFNFSQRFFYAAKEYRIPFWIAFFTGVMDVSLSLILKETSLRVSGLALANSTAFTIGAFVFVLRARKELGRIDGRLIMKTIFQTLLVSVFLAVFLIFFRKGLSHHILQTGGLTGLAVYAGGALGAVVIVLGGYRLLKVEMVEVFFHRGRRNK